MAKAKTPTMGAGNVAPLIAMLPLETRQLVDRLAKARQVSRSEIGRQAVTQYVERVLAGGGKESTDAGP